MKFHDPETEHELLRLAQLGRDGRPIEKRDKNSWRLPPVVFHFLLFASLLVGTVNAFPSDHREAHWQFAICGLVVTVVALLGTSFVLTPLNRPGDQAALMNLPVKGDFLFRMIRNRFLVRSLFWLGGLSFVFAFATSGFTFASPRHIIISTTLLLATTLATLVISYDPPAIIRHVRRLWILSSLLLAGGMILFHFNDSGYFETGATPLWLAEGISVLTWLFPSTWALPGRVEHGGGVLAVLWSLWGFVKWKEWPEVTGRHFDLPRDLFGSPGEPENEDDDVFPAETNASEEEAFTDSPLAVPGVGCVERWVRWCIGTEDALIAGALIDQNDTWSKRTRLTIISIPILLFINWLIIRFQIQNHWYELVADCVLIASVAAVPIPLLQIPNPLPRAMARCGEGDQSLPLLSLLPISVRDLLRISFRITLARSLILGAVVTPYFWCLLSIRDTGISATYALWMVPSLCGFWVMSRPLFVWYGLQTVTRCRRGMFLRDHALTWLVIGLAIAWIGTCLLGMVFGMAWLESTSSADDRVFFTVSTFGGILFSSLCARATFEIHHWRMRRGHFDWASEK